jgi:general secretion pathway protein N
MEGGAQPTLLLATREGSLQLSGSGRWNGSALRFDGEARAAPGREDALSNLLNIIGRRDGARSLITLG